MLPPSPIPESIFNTSQLQRLLLATEEEKLCLVGNGRWDTFEYVGGGCVEKEVETDALPPAVMELHN